MRIGLIWNRNTALKSISLSYSQCYRALSSLGHEVHVFTLGQSGSEFEYEVQSFTADQSVQAEYWRSQALDAAILVTSMNMSAVLRAIRMGGAKVICFWDTDGLIGYRVHPFAHLRWRIVYQSGALNKLRSFKFWIQKTLFDSAKNDREIIANLQLSNVTVVSNPETERLIHRYLACQRRYDLATSSVVARWPVHEGFCEPNLGRKSRLFLAVGRWHDPAKHVGLLACALSRYVRTGGNYEIAIVGPGGDTAFAPIVQGVPSVRYLGFQPRESLLPLLHAARGIIVSSRWESGPSAASEILAMGGTVIGTPIPALVGLVEGTQFGRVAIAHTPAALAVAIHKEERAWEQGDRDSQQIADYWRKVLNPVSACQRMLDHLKSMCDDMRTT